MRDSWGASPTDTVRMLTGTLTDVYSGTLLVGVDLGAGTVVIIPRLGSYGPRVGDIVMVLARSERMIVVGSLVTDAPVDGTPTAPGSMIGSEYVQRSGDTMTGRFYLAYRPIRTMEAVNKGYADDTFSPVAHTHESTPNAWYYEAFDLVDSPTVSRDLTYYPIERSEVVSLNGVRLVPGTDYNIVGRTISLVSPASTLLGIGADTWRLALNYACQSLVAPPVVEDAILRLSPWGYWKLDEPASLTPGANVVDYSGNNRHGRYDIAVPDVDQAPMLPNLSRSTLYDGGQDPVQIDHVQTTFHNGFTVTAWCQPTDVAGDRAVIGSTYEGGITLFKLVATGGVWRCESYWGGAFQQPEGSLAVVGTPQWVAARYDGATTLELFVDNVLVDTVTCSVPLPSGISQDYLRIATRGDNTPDQKYKGYISNVVVWDRALSDDDMDSVYRDGTGGAIVTTPGGTYTPPTPPATPGTHVLRYQRPSTTGYETLDVVAGGTFNLDNTKDYAITASGPIVSDYVRLVGGRNLDIFGLVFDFAGSIPTGSYDSARRGLHIKDGPNSNLKRYIYVEGMWLRSGYYSDGIQLALRRENAVTFICQALRGDAYGWGQRSGVHSDMIQFYGGPLNFLGDCITGKNLTYQGIFMRPADSRPLPTGADKVPWRLSRTNLESGSGPDGAARYLLWDDQPAWTDLTLDEVYIDGGRFDVTDSNGRIPSLGLHQDAVPAGGDWAPTSWWTGDTYTSPGYV